MNYHFIAIGGAVMHNLALELQHNKHKVSGSDDEILSPQNPVYQPRDYFPNHTVGFQKKSQPIWMG